MTGLTPGTPGHRAEHPPAAPAPSPGPSPVPALLRRITADPGRPRLTWYGPGGERVELSGHVLDNWVTKTANLLVEEMDAGPGTTAVLDLPAHWRAVVWALAAWRTGTRVVLHTGAPASGSVAAGAVVVTTRPADWADAPAEVVAVELAALARAFAGDLPPGAIDAAGAVMTYGDVLTSVQPTPGSAPALTAPPAGQTVAFEDLAAWSAAASAAEPWASDPGGAAPDGPGDTGPPRVLVPAQGLAALLAATLVVLGDGGSLVVVDPAAGVDLERVATTERVTASS